MSKFTFIDLFAGIGGFRIALESLGGKCVFSSEWNKFSRETYRANFGEDPAGDITKIDGKTIPDHDILVAGFPCQPFSIAGVSKKNSLGKPHGFMDEFQGNLFFDIARIIAAKHPKAFILENVKNLVHHEGGRTFRIIRSTLTAELGYVIFWRVIDASAYVPQHRERTIIVGFRGDINGDPQFMFPEPPAHGPMITAVLDQNPDPKYTLSDHLWEYLQNYAKKHREKGNGFGYSLIDPAKDRIARTLSARYYKDGSEILIRQEGRNPRRLTPEECRRLTGFPDGFFIPVSDTQAYMQLGNAVVPAVVRAVAEKVLEVMWDGQDIRGEKKLEHVQNPQQ